MLRRRKQKRTLWIGAVFFALTALFPPWTITRAAESGGAQLTHSSRYRLLWRPPRVNKGIEAASLDMERLMVEWAVIAVITGTALVSAPLTERESRALVAAANSSAAKSEPDPNR